MGSFSLETVEEKVLVAQILFAIPLPKKILPDMEKYFAPCHIWE
jgi:hypothetical protein